MLNDLVYFDNSIVGRYRTVERNIKSKSNSFYDSFLDLLENTIKRILVLENVPYDEKFTCGTLLREESIEKFFKEEIGVDDYTYSKCKDYIAKVNRHKHFNEHMINIDTVVTYVKVYYNLVSDYLKYKGKEVSPFNADYYNSIYGLTERENKELKNEVGRLKDDLETLALENKLSTEDNEIYKALISAQEMEKLSLEDQNIELRNQLSKLKDIKINTIELKLNKALELLYNLTDSVVESRAIGIAVGKSITGQDITQTDYMKDAVEIVRTKESIFEKLDKQGKDILDLSSKFSEMDIEDLYQAADKAFKEKNFPAAMKYYEQLCILKPKDWKPPFYVGVCKYYGSWDKEEYWDQVIRNLSAIMNTALEAIANLNVSDEEKNACVKEVMGIALSDYEQFNDNYEEGPYKSKFLKQYLNHIFDIQSYISSAIDLLDPFKGLDIYDECMKKLSSEYFRAIKLARGKCKSDVTEEQFRKYIGNNEIQYRPSSDNKAELPPEEEEPPKKKKKKLFGHR